jgi:hypothetical protein
MVDELHSLSEPRFVFLVVKLVQIAILRTGHEDSAILCANDRSHLNVCGQCHIRSIKPDFPVRTAVCCRRRGDREANEKNRDWCTYYEKMRYLVYEHPTFRFHRCNVGNDVWLVNERTYLLADKA